MYTVDWLEQKSLWELKAIAYDCGIVPAGDRRCRQNWIDALVGAKLPLLKLLETSPGVEVEAVQEAIELALDEKLPSEEEARSIVAQYLISTSLRKIRNAPPPATVFSPGQYVRIIEVVCRNSQFCGSIGIVAQHNFNVWVWVELDGGGRKIVICRPEKLQLIELVAEESVAKKEPIEIQRQEPIEELLDLNELWQLDEADCPVCGAIDSLYARWSREYAYGYWIICCQKCKLTCSCSIEELPSCLQDEDDEDEDDEDEDIELPITEPIETSPGIEVDSAKIRNDDYLDCPRCGTVGGLYATCPGQESVWETRCTCCDYLEPCIRHPFEDVRPFWVDRRREPIAPEAKITPDEVDGNTAETDGSTESATFVYLRAHAHHPSRTAAQSHGSSDGIESSTSEHEGSDRVLATARDGERDKGRALRSQPIELTAGFNDEQPPNRGDNGRDRLESAIGNNFPVVEAALVAIGNNFPVVEAALVAIGNNFPVVEAALVAIGNNFPVVEAALVAIGNSPGVTFSFRFLVLYSPPQPENIHYKSDSDGQLSLLDFEIESTDEPPDPHDFDSMFAFWAAYDAWLGEDDDSNEPPDTGIFARLPKPKLPSFPPMVVAQGDRSCKKFARSATILSGRSPPGGDPMN